MECEDSTTLKGCRVSLCLSLSRKILEFANAQALHGCQSMLSLSLWQQSYLYLSHHQFHRILVFARPYCLCANCLALMCAICNLISAKDSRTRLPLPEFHWQRLRYWFYGFRLVSSKFVQSCRRRIMNGQQFSTV